MNTFMQKISFSSHVTPIWKKSLWLFFFTGSFCFLSSMSEGSEQAKRLELELDAVKHRFENEIQGVGDQKQIAALAIRAASQAWLAAAAMTDQENELFDPAESLESLQHDWDRPGSSWPDREALGLKFYFAAVGRLAARIALKNNDKSVAEDLREFFVISRKGLLRPTPLTEPAVEAEAKVFWSNRICTLAAALGALLLNSPQRAELDDIVEDLLNRAEIVAKRTDIHYQGKMELLYLNNSQSLTSILFLLAKSPGSPFVEEALIMEEAWLNHVDQPGTQVADMLSLTWVTNAQIALPLVWWLAVETAPKEN
ncbi:MAG: hypothetical protein LBJ64_11755 [Deltaproteobacteria bacterium]|jgi:hypothetical protein|nr:hypothetical protein [Deltaproteobacteria bacterium]